MGLRPTKGDEDAVGRSREINNLDRVFSGAGLRQLRKCASRVFRRPRPVREPSPQDAGRPSIDASARLLRTLRGGCPSSLLPGHAGRATNERDHLAVRNRFGLAHELVGLQKLASPSPVANEESAIAQRVRRAPRGGSRTASRRTPFCAFFQKTRSCSVTSSKASSPSNSAA